MRGRARSVPPRATCSRLNSIWFALIVPHAPDAGLGSVNKPIIGAPLCSAFANDLARPDEVVINQECVCVRVGFPLKKPCAFIIWAPDGATNFTRAALFKSIQDLYRYIYTVDYRAASSLCRGKAHKRGQSGCVFGVHNYQFNELSLISMTELEDGTYDVVVDV